MGHYDDLREEEYAKQRRAALERKAAKQRKTELFCKECMMAHSKNKGNKNAVKLWRTETFGGYAVFMPTVHNPNKNFAFITLHQEVIYNGTLEHIMKMYGILHDRYYGI